MLQIRGPSPAFFRRILHSPGGFAWWYADLVDDRGNGVVLIWSMGLPFLPGQRRAEHVPTDRPSLCVAVYRFGQPAFYLLQEYSPGACRLNGPDGQGKVGDSVFSLQRDGPSVELTADLRAAVPGQGTLRGVVRVRGPLLGAQQPGQGLHLWRPLSFCARGEAKLDIAGQEISIAGSAYLDSNFSDTPLHEQGIACWRWGRVSFADRAVVYYQVDPADPEQPQQTMVLRQRPLQSNEPAEGSFARNEATHFEVPAEVCADGKLDFSDVQSGRYGMSGPRRVELSLVDERVRVELGRPVDDGPFYQRFVCRAEDAGGQVGYGICEQVAPLEVDRPWQRPFVQMRTHRVGGHNSMWLPLFCGSQHGRLGRLTRSWLGAQEQSDA